MAPVNLITNVGVISGDTNHNTGDGDYRTSKGLRVAVSIYIADLNDDIAKHIADDGMALFSVPGNTEWLATTKKGRLWGGGNTLKNDMGRLPYTAKDFDENRCPAIVRAGMCEKDP